MRCETASPGLSLPALPVPLLVTREPGRLALFYAGVLGLDLVHHVPGAFAFLRGGGLALQLWGRPDAAPGCASVTLEDGDASIFEIHANLARAAPALLDGSPRRMPWGGWQFRLSDIDGNRLVFLQWGARAQEPRRGSPGAPGRQGITGRP